MPQNGTAAYGASVTLNVPRGGPYAIVVGWRPTVGSGAWVSTAASPGTFTVN